jgi:Protein of unknown function (DUF1615)
LPPVLHHAQSQPGRIRRGLLLAGAIFLGSCIGPSRSPEPQLDPDVVRAHIAKLLPNSVANKQGWAIDIFTALESLKLKPTSENVCAAVAVAQQESNLQADPTVPGLPDIARKEIYSRAERYHIPQTVVNLALQLNSPNGKTYNERIESASTEKDLSDLFEDFIGSVPLGKKLFANWNPVRTGGPMQVSVAYAEAHVKQKAYPYPIAESVRQEVFTRRGGLYFGIAHLLDYDARYEDMIYRFADYNAGHYASRNAAFQNAVNALTRSKLATDGDLLLQGEQENEPSSTELAIRSIGPNLDMSDAAIRHDLEREKSASFADTKLYKRVFALADKGRKQPLPRAVLPKIKLQSAKITRNLTTEWFAKRVDQRYEQCLGRQKRT